MRSMTLAVIAVAALLVGCQKSATVQGEGARKLTLAKPAAVTIERGGTVKTDVQIKRTDLAGEVSVRFDKLPNGVTAVDDGTKIAGDAGTYTLKASDAADLVTNHSAQVTVTGPGGLSASEALEITVRDKAQ